MVLWFYDTVCGLSSVTSISVLFCQAFCKLVFLKVLLGKLSFNRLQPHILMLLILFITLTEETGNFC